MRRLLAVAGMALASVPLGLILTLALTPAWRWLEASRGIESVGHSGPAPWCYLATVLACATAAATAALAATRRRPARD